ncbi:MAG TPA: heme-binding domain-containing protein [Anaerolineales bacterium]|nr:heme-binding domain-containing protein [Anaerolineales bacterium]
MKKIFTFLIVAVIAIFLLIQLVPFGHDHTNPPTVSEPQWSSPAARSLVKEHCFQCHSNETQWTWYSYIAPASWLVGFDVVAGRSAFNFSEWNTNPGEVDEMVGAIQEGEMPPIQYWIFHPNSRLNDQQKAELINALQSSLR